MKQERQPVIDSQNAQEKTRKENCTEEEVRWPEENKPQKEADSAQKAEAF